MENIIEVWLLLPGRYMSNSTCLIGFYTWDLSNITCVIGFTIFLNLLASSPIPHHTWELPSNIFLNSSHSSELNKSKKMYSIVKDLYFSESPSSNWTEIFHSEHFTSQNFALQIHKEPASCTFHLLALCIFVDNHHVLLPLFWVKHASILKYSWEEMTSHNLYHFGSSMLETIFNF